MFKALVETCAKRQALQTANSVTPSPRTMSQPPRLYLDELEEENHDKSQNNQEEQLNLISKMGGGDRGGRNLLLPRDVYTYMHMHILMLEAITLGSYEGGGGNEMK